MDTPRFSDITTIAYQELFTNKITGFPISVEDIAPKDYIIISFQKYSEITRVPLSLLMLNGEYSDGLTIKGLRPGLNFILYNADSYEARERYTIFHEIGHIKCDHTEHGDIEEIEAHFFAAQLLMPNIIIKEIMSRGIKIDINFLMDFFQVSRESAEKKMDYLRRFPQTHRNNYDDIVLQQFRHFLDASFPIKSSIFLDDYDRDMEMERLNW